MIADPFHNSYLLPLDRLTAVHGSIDGPRGDYQFYPFYRVPEAAGSSPAASEAPVV
jgi:hypothetical protein